MYVPDLGGIILLRKWKPGVECLSNPPCREWTNHPWVWIPQCSFSVVLSRLLCWFTSLGGGQWWDLTQHCRSHGGLRAWPASLLSTATCLIIPKDICKCEKQICTVPCWRLRCLPDLRRQPSSYWHPPRVLQRNKVQQETKVSAQLQKGTWVLVFPPQTTLTHSITKASVSKSWIMELSQIH